MTDTRGASARTPAFATIAGSMALATVAFVVVAALADPGVLVIGSAALFYSGPGLVVLARRDWHMIGWLLLVTGFLYAAQIGMSNADPFGPVHLLSGPWMAWFVEGWLVNGVFSGVTVLVVMFPEGLSSRSGAGRAVDVATITISVAIIVASMLLTQVGGGTQYPTQPNPTGLGFVPVAVTDLLVPIQLLLLFVAIGRFWLRSRASVGAERAQYRWVGFAFVIVILGTVLAVVAPVVGVTSQWPLLLLLIGIYLVPISFSLAIVRFGLYAIDRIVSRTVTYGLVASIIAVIYVVPVVALPGLVGGSNDLIVAGATLTAAAVFTPLRRRIQRVVDHRFNRSRYDSDREMGSFTARLETTVSIAAVTEDLSGVVARTLSPSTSGVWLRTAGGRTE